MIQQSSSVKEIGNALRTFHKEMTTVSKTSENPYFKSKYADLSNILTAIKEPLQTAKLAFAQFPSGTDGLTTILIHEGGEWIRSEYTMTPAKNDPQGRGSAITYQRRYALSSILGLNAEDDDGNAASTQNAPKEAIKEPVITYDQSVPKQPVKKVSKSTAEDTRDFQL